MTDLNGRKALVTGAAQGLGEGMARALAAAGATVVVADLQQDLGQKVAESLGDGHGFVSLDVTDDAGWESAVSQAIGLLGGLDILVNNAGIEITSLLVDLDAGAARKQLEVNLLGTALGIKHAFRTMRPGGAAGARRRGHQRGLGRRDHRVPRHRRLLGHQVGRRPAHPRRRDGVRQAGLRRPGQLHLSRPRPDRDGRRAGQRLAPGSACSARRRRRSARSSGSPRRGGWARSTTWPPRWCSSPPTRPASSTGSACRSTAEWGCDAVARQACRRLRCLRLHRPADLRVPARVPRSVHRRRPRRRQAQGLDGGERRRHRDGRLRDRRGEPRRRGADRACSPAPRSSATPSGRSPSSAPRSSRRAWPAARTTSTRPASRTGSITCDEKYGADFAAAGLLLAPGVAQMYTTGEIAAELCLERPGLDTLDIAVFWGGSPTIASTLTILVNAALAGAYYLEQNQYVAVGSRGRALPAGHSRSARAGAGAALGRHVAPGLVPARPAGRQRQGARRGVQPAADAGRPADRGGRRRGDEGPAARRAVRRADGHRRAGDEPDAAQGEPAGQQVPGLGARVRAARPGPLRDPRQLELQADRSAAGVRGVLAAAAAAEAGRLRVGLPGLRAPRAARRAQQLRAGPRAGRHLRGADSPCGWPTTWTRARRSTRTRPA